MDLKLHFFDNFFDIEKHFLNGTFSLKQFVTQNILVSPKSITLYLWLVCYLFLWELLTIN
jgi:hypothetical protein